MEPVHVVGTSFGAVLGAALAAGVSHTAVAKIAAGITRDRVARVDPIALVLGSFAKSFLRDNGLRAVIRELVPARRFDDLQIPLTVTATDLSTGALTLFGASGRRDTPLLDALYASCALPVYYAPARIDGVLYGDGGLRAVLPLEVARALDADLVVAVHVGSGFDEAPPPPSTGSAAALPPLVRAHGEALRIMMAAQVEHHIAAWPADAPRLVLVRPIAVREATFAIERAGEYMDAGYRTTREALAVLRN